MNEGRGISCKRLGLSFIFSILVRIYSPFLDGFPSPSVVVLSFLAPGKAVQASRLHVYKHTCGHKSHMPLLKKDLSISQVSCGLASYR